MTIIILYVMHILLFGVKLGLVVNMGIILYNADHKFKWCMPLFIFSVISVVVEVWFIYNFFNDIVLYYYEYLAIFDEILFTILVTYYIMKEVNHGKNQNEWWR